MFITEVGHLRKKIMAGKETRFVERRGPESKMRSHYREGGEYPLWLSKDQRFCLRRLGVESGEFVVRVAAIDKVPPQEAGGKWELVVRVERVTPMPEDVKLDMFVKYYWI